MQRIFIDLGMHTYIQVLTHFAFIEEVIMRTFRNIGTVRLSVPVRLLDIAFMKLRNVNIISKQVALLVPFF